MPLVRQGMYTAIMKLPVMLQALTLALLVPAAASAACTVCHSKKPEMRRMHEALNYKDCFTCHGPAATPVDRNNCSEDQRCMPCHKK